MNSIAALIGTACVCAVAVSLLSLLSPNGIMSKNLNLVIGLFIICVMLVPVKNFITNFNADIKTPKIPDSITSDAQKAYDNSVITETETRLEKSLQSTLLNNGHKIKSVDIKTSLNKDRGIYIAGINIYIDSKEKNIQKIIRSTEEEFKVTPKVTVKE